MNCRSFERAAPAFTLSVLFERARIPFRRMRLLIPLSFALAALSCEVPAGATRTDAATDSGLACSAPEALARLSALPEVSGLAAAGSRHDVWAHNDSERPTRLYRLDGQGRVVQRVRVPQLTDFEDIAAARCAAGDCLYLADIGDNLHQRSTVRVLRIRRPAARDREVTRADAFVMRYPEGPADAEAIFVLPGERLHVITKGRNRPAALYRYPGRLREGTVTLERVQVLQDGIAQFPDMVTGASATLDGGHVAVRTYGYVELYRVREAGLELAGRVPLDALGEAQGEGVALRDDGEMLLASEGRGGGTVARLRCRLP